VRRADGPQTIYYRISVYEDATSDQADTTPPFPPSPVINEPFNTAVNAIVADVRDQSADTESFTSELLRRMNDPSPGPNVELMMSGVTSNTDFVEVVTWRYFNPTTGEEGMPLRYLIWWRGNERLVNVEGGSNVQVSFAVQETHVDAVAIAETHAAKQGGRLIDFSLYGLPIQTQAVYSVLLMIPIGALVMVFMRNFIGIDTFGTFMPVLIALAFRETKLFLGVVLFTLLVALGLSIRFLLERLRLLLVPRLSAVLIVVVLLMLLISLISHKLGMETGLSVALFPMVIIVMTIERMSVVWEERGAVDAMRAGFGSLMVASRPMSAWACPGSST